MQNVEYLSSINILLHIIKIKDFIIQNCLLKFFMIQESSNFFPSILFYHNKMLLFSNVINLGKYSIQLEFQL